MKTLTTRIENRVLTIRCPDDYPPFCDKKDCRLYGRVFVCYTLDYKYCDKDIPKPTCPHSSEVFLEEKRWNQL
jgi:hypothetical protein